MRRQIGSNKRDAVLRFCATVSEGSTANLALLKAIDETVGWLSAIQKEVEGFLGKAHKFTEFIKSCDRKAEIDPGDEISACILLAEKNVRGLVEYLSRKRQSAVDARELIGSNKKTVVSEYNQTIEKYSELHDAMLDLRWAIMEHDADLSKVSRDYADVEELIKDLDA